VADTRENLVVADIGEMVEVELGTGSNLENLDNREHEAQICDLAGFHLICSK
jgi:hypothetical protein